MKRKLLMLFFVCLCYPSIANAKTTTSNELIFQVDRIENNTLSDTGNTDDLLTGLFDATSQEKIANYDKKTQTLDEERRSQLFLSHSVPLQEQASTQELFEGGNAVFLRKVTQKEDNTLSMGDASFYAYGIFATVLLIGLVSLSLPVIKGKDHVATYISYSSHQQRR